MKSDEELRKVREDLRKQGVKRLRPESQRFHELASSDPEANDPESLEEKGLSDRAGARILSLLLGLFLVLCLIGWAVIRWGGEGQPVKSSPPAVRLNFLERSAPAEVERSVDHAVKGFMSAKSLSERAQFVIGGGEVLAKMKEFYGRKGHLPPDGCSGIPDQISGVSGGGLMIGARGIDLNGSSTWFTLVPGMEGMLIDWESTVGYGEMPWAQFLKERPTEELTMRVYLVRFIDEEDQGKKDVRYYYKVSDRSNSSSVIAVPSQGSELEARLPEVVAARANHPVTVRIRFREGQPFAEITELVHDLWVDLKRVEQWGPRS